jgi:hypothetical protein
LARDLEAIALASPEVLEARERVPDAHNLAESPQHLG